MMNIYKLLFSKVRSSSSDLFEDIIGYDGIKKLFGMALDSDEPVHILLSGPPASAKTVFMRCLMKLQDSYFIDGGNTTKSGITDYVFSYKPKYLLIDEIDKMPSKDQAFLLNLMETGIVTEIKHRKTRTAQMKTWVFATSNNISKVMTPLQSRFFTVTLEPYSYEQFYEISVHLLIRQHKVKQEIAKATACTVWNTMNSANIRDCCWYFF
jgi:replication-associated recombination protein RarA